MLVTAHPPRITVMSMNISHGALRTAAGGADDRWDPMASLVRDLAPDVLALQETSGWGDHNRQQSTRAEESTGLRVIWPAPGHDTLIMYNPDTVGATQWEDRYTLTRGEPGFSGIGVFTVPGLVSPLSIASVHLAPDSADLARIQASRLAWRCRRYLGPCGEGENGVIIGDLNQPPGEHPLDPQVPTPDTLPAANLTGRWRGSSRNMSPDRSVAELLERSRWTDAAHVIADRDGRTDVLAATGRGGWRVDQAWVTEGLVPAIVDLQPLNVPGSDHKGLLLVMDPGLIDPSLVTVPNR
ncbi:endonuclease/exonuclease/phosphatase family protein [Nocardiopsis flavescens]|uniref:endonuclease/exonuclease/phosphatase family protein n=1 Tax=Nocardiopsis flavescens TaxID=758803 RepID=UPI0036573131